MAVGTIRHRRRLLQSGLTYILLAFVVAIFTLPPVWVLITSIKPANIIHSSPPVWLFTPTLDHYAEVLNDDNLPNYFWNTIVVSVVSTIIALTFGSLAAYSMSRFRTGGRYLLFATLVVRVLPPVVLGIPFFVMFNRLGLSDNILALVLTYTTFNLPFAIWLLIAFFDEVPSELEDAARIDGCSRFGVFRRIALPLVQPGLVVGGILTFMYSWNHFFFAVVLTSSEAKTLPIVAAQYVTTWGIRWGALAAIATLIMLLPILLVFILQKRLVRGIAFGGVKG